MKAFAWRAGVQPFDYWLIKNRYYHSLLKRFYCFMVPAQSRVLHIGCKNGYLLGSLKPSYAVGVDENSAEIAVAQQRYPHIMFYQALREIPAGSFDYIILSSTITETTDVQQLFEQLKVFCNPRTRIVIDWYSMLWEPVLWITQKLGLRRPTELTNWLSVNDVKNFLYLAGFETITTGTLILLPINIPGISWLCNNILAWLPGFSLLCVNHWLVARLQPKVIEQKFSVSVIVPCRNERGNVEPAILRTPDMSAVTELIFIEGNSQDGTWTEIERVIAAYPDKNIKGFQQAGKGKGDAVRLGFDKASGDILMILDGDLTMPPEELPKFYEALISQRGELINGCRLVYGMEDGAMRLLNLVANWGFGLGFSWLLGQPIKDTLCGTKVLFKSDYQKIVAHRSFFGDFDPFGDFDLLFGAAKQHMKILDLPIRYKNRTYGETQIRRFYHGILLVKMCFVALRKFKMY